VVLESVGVGRDAEFWLVGAARSARAASIPTVAHFSLLGQVDPKLSAVQRVTVELAYCAFSFLIVGHLDESEPARPSGFAVERKSDGLDRPGLAEQSLQVIFPDAVGKVADV
jgi:hypothetical protein